MPKATRKFHQNLNNINEKNSKITNFCKILPKHAKKFDEHFLKYWGLSGAKACKYCRSRQKLSNEYLLAKIGFDTAENEPINFHNFSSLQGFDFHRAVVSADSDQDGSLPQPLAAKSRGAAELTVVTRSCVRWKRAYWAGAVLSARCWPLGADRLDIFSGRLAKFRKKSVKFQQKKSS